MLFNFGTGEDVEFVGVGRFDAGLNFVIGGGSNHGSIVAGEFWKWKITFETMKLSLEFFGILAESLVGRNTASDDERFGFGILFNGRSDFFKENFSDGLVKRSGEIGFSSIVK